MCCNACLPHSFSYAYMYHLFSPSSISSHISVWREEKGRKWEEGKGMPSLLYHLISLSLSLIGDSVFILQSGRAGYLWQACIYCCYLIYLFLKLFGWIPYLAGWFPSWWYWKWPGLGSNGRTGGQGRQGLTGAEKGGCMHTDSLPFSTDMCMGRQTLISMVPGAFVPFHLLWSGSEAGLFLPSFPLLSPTYNEDLACAFCLFGNQWHVSLSLIQGFPASLLWGGGRYNIIYLLSINNQQPQKHTWNPLSETCNWN